MNKNHRKRLLSLLMRRCGGRCTNCNVEVGVVGEMLRRGWQWLRSDALLVGPKGEVLFVATIEHLHPRGKGGGDQLSNLTLYCEHCNRKTAHFGLPAGRGCDGEPRDGEREHV